MKKKYIKNIILFFVIINTTNAFSATVYNTLPTKIGPSINLENNIITEQKIDNIITNKTYYIKDTKTEEYTIKYDDINDKNKFANIRIFLPIVFIENEEKSNIANYFIQSTAIDILKEYAKKYIIDFNENRASMRCAEIIKKDEYVYKLKFLCSSIPMCNIIIDFANMQCFSE